MQPNDAEAEKFFTLKSFYCCGKDAKTEFYAL